MLACCTQVRRLTPAKNRIAWLCLTGPGVTVQPALSCFALLVKTQRYKYAASISLHRVDARVASWFMGIMPGFKLQVGLHPMVMVPTRETLLKSSACCSPKWGKGIVCTIIHPHLTLINLLSKDWTKLRFQQRFFYGIQNWIQTASALGLVRVSNWTWLSTRLQVVSVMLLNSVTVTALPQWIWGYDKLTEKLAVLIDSSRRLKHCINIGDLR